MAKLLQLPNGQWIDPATVFAVKAIPRDTGHTGVLHAPRVIVNYAHDPQRGGYQVEVLDCESWDDSEALRDHLAALVNDPPASASPAPSAPPSPSSDPAP